MNDIRSPDRLAWEREWDCIRKMREWIIDNTLADDELSEVENHPKESKRQRHHGLGEIPGTDQATGVGRR